MKDILHDISQTCQTTWDPKSIVRGSEEVLLSTSYDACNVSVISKPEKSWNEAMEEVLEKRAETWKRLADL